MYEFIIKDDEFILDKIYSCREFQLDRLPYEHVLVVCRCQQTLPAYDTYSNYYSNESWVAV